MSRLLTSLSHEVLVANARQVKLISQSSRKDDRLDAQTLARLARLDPKLLRPIRHRSEKKSLDRTGLLMEAARVSKRLENVPKELVVDLVVKLHFGHLHEGTEQSRAAVRRSLPEAGVAALHVVAEHLARSCGRAEVGDGVVSVIRQVPGGLAQILNLADVAVKAGLEDRGVTMYGLASGATERCRSCSYQKETRLCRETGRRGYYLYRANRPMGEQEANRLICALFESWASFLFRYAYTLMRSHAAAEDLVQEAFFCLYREIRRGSVIVSPRGWTLRVVRNLAGNMKRHTARHPEDLYPLERFDQMEARDKFSYGQGDEYDADEVEVLLAELSSRESEVLLLRLQAMKYKDIAAQLQISDKSVATFLARALKKLRMAASSRLLDGSSPVRRKANASRPLQ